MPSLPETPAATADQDGAPLDAPGAAGDAATEGSGVQASAAGVEAAANQSLPAVEHGAQAQPPRPRGSADDDDEHGAGERPTGAVASTSPSGLTPARRRRGRRPAGTDTRAEILRSARELFLANGYDHTSIRAVAREAGVDPALVHHYFAGKPALFAASVLPSQINPVGHLDALSTAAPKAIGEAMVRGFLTQWDGVPQPEVKAAMLATMTPSADSQPLRGFILREVFGRIPLPPQPAAQAALRRELLSSQVLGLALCRYVMAMPFLADASVDELAGIYGPVLQRYIDGPLAGDEPASTAPDA